MSVFFIILKLVRMGFLVGMAILAFAFFQAGYITDSVSSKFLLFPIGLLCIVGFWGVRKVRF